MHCGFRSPSSPLHLVPDLLLVGTGETVQNIDPSIYDYFRQRGVSVETMATVRAWQSRVAPLPLVAFVCFRKPSSGLAL